MGDVVNFRVVRKRAARQQANADAAANRLAHGRSKAERSLDEARSEKACRELDAHRIETRNDR
jgi:Domain of unknown function (DUF4169)